MPIKKEERIYGTVQVLHQSTGTDVVLEVAILSSIGTFVAADGKLTDEEHEFLQSILKAEFDYDLLLATAQAAVNKGFENTIDKIIDDAPSDVKKAFLILCLCFIACDGEITPDEKALLIKYLE